MIQRIIAFTISLLLFPLWTFLYLLVVATSKGPFIFRQKRLGKNKIPFTIYKIRTMIEEAEQLKKNYRVFNEAQLPAFKIRHDPRFTKVGALLSYLGIDELPQLWNIVKGEMAFVGPRPLPIPEAKKINKKYVERFSVLPGITSLWVIAGTRRDSFEKWMQLDLQYIRTKNVLIDLSIISLTALFLLKLLYRTSLKKLLIITPKNQSSFYIQ